MAFTEICRVAYDFFKDQGSSLGAVATFLAVVAALRIATKQTRAAKAIGDAQINAVRDQMRQRLDAEQEAKLRQQLDLLRALGNEAVRIKMLALEGLQVADPRKTSTTSLTKEGRGEAFVINTTGVMRQSAGISELPGSLLAPVSKLVASVDQLNSKIEVRAKFGQLGWP